MKVFAVIMAGGIGSRFWPKSRETTPKQFQNVFDGKSLYQRTLDRVTRLILPENTFVVTNRAQQPLALEQAPGIPKKNIIAEPFGRNTAPCIAVAASAISSMTDNAVMVVLPSDHLIPEDENFISQLKDAIRLADIHRALVTIGIGPTYPETGFGYIHYDAQSRTQELMTPPAGTGSPIGPASSQAGPPMSGAGYKVISFKEKPDHDTAVKFVQSGDYLWNSGMFIWRVDVILDELTKNLAHFSDFHLALKSEFGKADFEKVIEKFYLQVDPISVDYAVMEKASNALTMRSNFIWSDVGSWDEIYRMENKDADGNAFKGEVVSVRSKNNLVWSEDKLISVVEVEDLIVVETKDALLISKRGKSQSVKEIIELLKKRNRQDLV
ncbi:MAG: mannose-1-phosphate guanylyltransferase [Candidatus Kryptoniota bacterium]